jgi:hypothetical protein
MPLRPSPIDVLNTLLKVRSFSKSISPKCPCSFSPSLTLQAVRAKKRNSKMEKRASQFNNSSSYSFSATAASSD